MKKRRVLHQACAFSVAVMLVGVNAVPVVAADNNSSATTVATDEKAFNITVTFNYWDYAVGADGQHFLTKEMTSGDTITPPTLTVEEGYELKGWTINDKFFDATAQMSYEDIVRAAGTSEFVAIQAVIKPVEIKKTAHVAFNVDPEKGKFTDPAGAKVVTYDLDETDGDAHPIPKVEAKEGYEFTGWHVSGANEADWLPESETFYVSGLAFYEKDKNDGYVTFEATFKEKEAAVEKKDAELRVHYVDVNSDNYIKDNIQTIKKNGKVGESAEFTAKDLTIPKGYELADDKWSTSVEYGKDADVNVNVKAKEEPAEEKTVEVYFNIIDSEKGSFPDYAPSTVVSFKGIAADTDQQFEIPAVKANDGYKFTGWKVEGAETQNWDADAKTFGVKGYDKSNLRKSDLYIEKYITLATTPYKRNVTVGKFKYQITGRGECTLTGATAKGKKVTNLTINKGVTYNGLTYSISKIGDKAFKNNTYLKKINITAVKKIRHLR